MTARLAATVSRPLLAILCGALAACSSFDAQWRAAENPATAPGLTRWEGRWASARHTTQAGTPDGGRLRCVLEPADGQKLHACFRANWKVFTSDYAMSLAPVESGRAAPAEFRGTHELPAIFGGTYRYTARIAGDRLTARYESSYDRGTFTLQRLRRAKDSLPVDSGH